MSDKVVDIPIDDETTTASAVNSSSAKKRRGLMVAGIIVCSCMIGAALLFASGVGVGYRFGVERVHTPARSAPQTITVVTTKGATERENEYHPEDTYENEYHPVDTYEDELSGELSSGELSSGELSSDEAPLTFDVMTANEQGHPETEDEYERSSSEAAPPEALRRTEIAGAAAAVAAAAPSKGALTGCPNVVIDKIGARMICPATFEASSKKAGVCARMESSTDCSWSDRCDPREFKLGGKTWPNRQWAEPSAGAPTTGGRTAIWSSGVWETNGVPTHGWVAPCGSAAANIVTDKAGARMICPDTFKASSRFAGMCIRLFDRSKPSTGCSWSPRCYPEEFVLKYEWAGVLVSKRWPNTRSGKDILAHTHAGAPTTTGVMTAYTMKGDIKMWMTSGVPVGWVAPSECPNIVNDKTGTPMICPATFEASSQFAGACTRLIDLSQPSTDCLWSGTCDPKSFRLQYHSAGTPVDMAWPNAQRGLPAYGAPTATGRTARYNVNGDRASSMKRWMTNGVPTSWAPPCGEPASGGEWSADELGLDWSSACAQAAKHGGHFDVPAGATEIPEQAFEFCTSLTSISIPDSVKSIGTAAFYDSALRSVTIPDSVTTIAHQVFWGCSSLTSVTIGNKVETIGVQAFEKCTSLTSITIPDSVKTIRGDAFNGCTSLKSITIPNSVTAIGNRAFLDCASLHYCDKSDANIGVDAFLGTAGKHCID